MLQKIMQDIITEVPLTFAEMDKIKEILKEHLGYTREGEDETVEDMSVFEIISDIITMTYIHDPEMRKLLHEFDPIGIAGTNRVYNAGQLPILQINLLGRRGGNKTMEVQT